MLPHFKNHFSTIFTALFIVFISFMFYAKEQIYLVLGNVSRSEVVTFQLDVFQYQTGNCIQSDGQD